MSVLAVREPKIRQVMDPLILSVVISRQVLHRPRGRTAMGCQSEKPVAARGNLAQCLGFCQS